jgi:hypothetical protein
MAAHMTRQVNPSMPGISTSVISTCGRVDSSCLHRVGPIVGQQHLVLGTRENPTGLHPDHFGIVDHHHHDGRIDGRSRCFGSRRRRAALGLHSCAIGCLPALGFQAGGLDQGVALRSLAGGRLACFGLPRLGLAGRGLSRSHFSCSGFALGQEALFFQALFFQALGFQALFFQALGFQALGLDALGLERFCLQILGGCHQSRLDRFSQRVRLVRRRAGVQRFRRRSGDWPTPAGAASRDSAELRAMPRRAGRPSAARIRCAGLSCSARCAASWASRRACSHAHAPRPERRAGPRHGPRLRDAPPRAIQYRGPRWRWARALGVFPGSSRSLCLGQIGIALRLLGSRCAFQPRNLFGHARAPARSMRLSSSRSASECSASSTDSRLAASSRCLRSVRRRAQRPCSITPKPATTRAASACQSPISSIVAVPLLARCAHLWRAGAVAHAASVTLPVSIAGADDSQATNSGRGACQTSRDRAERASRRRRRVRSRAAQGHP